MCCSHTVICFERCGIVISQLREVPDPNKKKGMKNDIDEVIKGTDLRLGEKVIETAREIHTIFNILMESKQGGNCIAISSLLTGDGFIITAVDDIIFLDGATVICLKPYDVTGFMLPVCKIRLSQIKAACPMKSKFINPVLRNLTKGKNWFF